MSAGASFDKVVLAEVEAINARRAELNRPDKLEVGDTGSKAPPLDAVGLALSGGGVRSASFCLGVLQAFNEHGVLKRIDYLSTVSGGGYMGAALSATLAKTKGRFVLGESTGMRASVSASDVKDTDSVRQIRNYSNYLIPFGARDLLTAIAIIVRGLAANVALVLPFVLAAAAFTILCNPSRSFLAGTDFVGIEVGWLPVEHFGLTLLLTLCAFPLFLFWAIYRSLIVDAEKLAEFRTWLPAIGGTYLLLIAGTFFCELQPYLIAGIFDMDDKARAAGNDFSLLTSFVQWVATIAAPVAGAVTLFRQQLGTLLKSVTASSGLGAKAAAFAGEAALWLAGAALPLLIWIGYLYLCYWAIINNGKAIEQARPQVAIQGSVQIEGSGINLRGTLDCRLVEVPQPCGAPSTPADKPSKVNADVVHTPSWLIGTAKVVSDMIRAKSWLPDLMVNRPITLLYIVLALLLFVLSYVLRPNANSLHRLYRDRLSKAFLFDPTRHNPPEGIDRGRDFAPLDNMPISELATPYGPYHLINAALNIQGSDYANRRGRNADFFLFSPKYTGSDITGYADTTAVERDSKLDLATAIAISGAAFSSNMGSNSIKALTPTLALLNIRTGFWLRNPMSLLTNGAATAGRWRANWYLWKEITGRLFEDSEEIYLTDGGHIENLGVYQLLRRRCRFIVVVDAEADPSMRFSSFITLQRYARLDLGARINMPWDKIRKSTGEWMGFDGSKELESSDGPHCAIGTIDYDGGEQGWILYIKSSLTGDENDYVRDYARRFAAFPHETTGDQFFSEEQFEVYRALGFHAADGLLRGNDDLQVFQNDSLVRFTSSDPNIDPMRAALL